METEKKQKRKCSGEGSQAAHQLGLQVLIWERVRKRRRHGLKQAKRYGPERCPQALRDNVLTPGAEWAAPGHGHLYVCLPYTCVLAGPCLQVLSSFKILVACSFQSNTMRSICPQGLESHVLPQALGAPAQGGHLPSTSSVVDHISILRDILYLSPHHT